MPSSTSAPRASSPRASATPSWTRWAAASSRTRPIQPFQVTVSAPDHPLNGRHRRRSRRRTRSTCASYTDGITPLLETRFSGTFEAGYVRERLARRRPPPDRATCKRARRRRGLLPDPRPLQRQVRHAADARGDRGRARLLEPPRLLRPPPPRPEKEPARVGAVGTRSSGGELRTSLTSGERIALRSGHSMASPKRKDVPASSTLRMPCARRTRRGRSGHASTSAENRVAAPHQAPFSTAARLGETQSRSSTPVHAAPQSTDRASGKLGGVSMSPARVAYLERADMLKGQSFDPADITFHEPAMAGIIGLLLQLASGVR